MALLVNRKWLILNPANAPVATHDKSVSYWTPSEAYELLIYVTVQANESIDSALKRFNMKLQQSGLLRELKEHAHYEKPSEKRRRLKRRRASRQ